MRQSIPGYYPVHVVSQLPQASSDRNVVHPEAISRQPGRYPASSGDDQQGPVLPMSLDLGDYPITARCRR